jgi:hypothetical protein
MTDTTATLLAQARQARIAEISDTLAHLREKFRCQLSDDAAWTKDDKWLADHLRLHKTGEFSSRRRRRGTGDAPKERSA